MKTRRFVIAGLALAALMVVGAVSLQFLPGTVNAGSEGRGNTHETQPPTASGPSDHSTQRSDPVPRDSRHSKTPPASRRAATDTPATAGEHGGTSPSPTTGTTTTPDPGSTATPNPKKPLEVLPPVKDSGDALPESREHGPLIDGPLPASAAKKGTLVKGFPRSAVSPVPSSKVRSSSVSSQGARLRVSMVATVDSEPAAVMSYYYKHLGRLGFGVEAAPAVSGSTAAQFSRLEDNITVTTTTKKAGTRYIIVGVLHVKN